MLVDRVLPGEEFFDGEGVAAAGFLEGKQAAAHGSNDLGLAPDDPALRARCRQIGDRQRAAVRPDNVFCPWSKGFRHGSTHALDFGNAGGMYRPRLKIYLNGTLQWTITAELPPSGRAVRCRKGFELVDCRRSAGRKTKAVRRSLRWRRSVPQRCWMAESNGIPTA